MSRTTQYIGLNKYAREYVKSALIVESYDMTTGMFDETIIGKIYYMPTPDGPNSAYIFKEVVQISPWSSGPMIFTSLEVSLKKDSGQIIEMGRYFDWMIDPSIKCEYDFETARYYV